MNNAPKNVVKVPIRRKKRVLRNNVQDFKKPMFQRMIRIVGHPFGVTRASGMIYEELRGVMKVIMEDIIRAAVAFMESKRVVTITGEMVSMSLEQTGMGKMYGSGAKNSKRNGTSVSDLIGMPFAAFDRLTREVTQDFSRKCRWTGDAMRLLKKAVEHIMVSIVSSATHLASYAKRQTLMPRDIQMARRLRNGCTQMLSTVRYAGNGLGMTTVGREALRKTLRKKTSTGGFDEKRLVLPGKGILKLRE